MKPKSDSPGSQHLYNGDDLATLIEKLKSDQRPRDTLSFYKYQQVNDPTNLRNHYFQIWQQWGVLGRIYIAQEGINAQLSVPAEFTAALKASVAETFPDMIFKTAVEDNAEAFYKLVIKVKNKIVADGLEDGAFDTSKVGRHLTAEEFNEAMDEDAIVVDVRNHYESEVGHFVGAIKPDVDTFREELPAIKSLLEGKEDEKILLYCTGGIRCEKASAWLKHQGFKDVNQLHGGIIDYAHQIKAKGLPSKFIGKNFVFDNRLGERITNDVLTVCHSCDAACDDHTNCAWQGCHVLIILCEKCRERFGGCCSRPCYEKTQLPEAEQKLLRQTTPSPPRFSKGRKKPPRQSL